MFPMHVKIFIPRAALLMGGDVKEGDWKRDEAQRREVKEIFRVPLTKADVDSRLNMRCVMMR